MARTNYVQGAVEPYGLQLEALMSASSVIFGSYLLDEQRVWMVPEPYLGWDYDVHHLSGAESLIEAFDRDTDTSEGGDSLNTRYVKALRAGAEKKDSVSGKVAETKCAKMQIDELAAMERAYRTRVASPVRCALHAAARKKGHSHADGVIGRKIQLCANMIRAAQVDRLPERPDPPEDVAVADNSTESPIAVV